MLGRGTLERPGHGVVDVGTGRLGLRLELGGGALRLKSLAARSRQEVSAAGETHEPEIETVSSEQGFLGFGDLAQQLGADPPDSRDRHIEPAAAREESVVNGRAPRRPRRRRPPPSRC